MLVLFHDKKCGNCFNFVPGNCFNFVPCILWDFIVLGLVLSWWIIKHVLYDQSGFCKCLTKSLLAIEPYEKHMLEVEESCQAVSFTSVSREGPTCEILAKLFSWRILSVTFIPFTHTIYTLITYKSMRSYSKRKTLDRFSTTQHTHLLERESY